MQIKAITKDGKTKEYQVILTYFSEEYNKHYIVYTDNIYNSNEELQIYINEYQETDEKIISKDITNKEEYTKIKTIVNSILLTMKNEQ